MKKICLLIVSIFLFNTLCFAQIKIFTKQGESVVQKDQSVNQVISYLKQKLTREAQEEAGTFITTNLKIENYQITKDEFTSFAGSISKTTVLEETPFMKDKEQYVKVKIKVDIDIDNVEAYLEKIMQDNEYKEQAQKAIKEAEELKKKNLELENKLKTATKQEYEQKLSLQAQQQIQEQKQREIELNKMAVQAKEEYAKIKEEQLQLQQKREQEILKLKERIAQEKDNVKKAELENQAKIKELELKAKENQQKWNTNTNKISIQQAIQEATKVKQETNEIITQFVNLSKENKDTIYKSYDEQIQLSCNTSPKDQWETEEEYNSRLEKNRLIEGKLEKEKEESIFEHKRKTIESIVTTLKPFIEKLQYFQTEKFYDEKGSKAELLSIGEVNIDDQYFVLNIKYNKKKYKLNYDFSKIGKEQAKLMCQTQKQFVIEPMFSVNDKLKQELTAFNIKHLGTKEEKIIDNSIKVEQFNEIEIFNDYKSVYDKNKSNIDFIDSSNNIIDNLLFEFKNDDTLNKFTEIIKILEEARNVENFEKLKRIEEFRTFVESLKQLDNLVIKVSGDYKVSMTSETIIVGLKKNGSVNVYYQIGDKKNNRFEEVNQWFNIVDIITSCKVGIIGIKKDGMLIVSSNDNELKHELSKWRNVRHIQIFNSTYGYSIVGIKNNGRIVFYSNKENYDDCNKATSLWKNIVSVYFNGDYIIGLQKDGKIIYTKINKHAKDYIDYSKIKFLENIKQIISATVYLKEDGNIVCIDNNEKCEFVDLKNISKIFKMCYGSGYYSFVVLSKNGIVKNSILNINWNGIINIEKVGILANNIIALRKDGTILNKGVWKLFRRDEEYKYIHYDIDNWGIEIPRFNNDVGVDVDYYNQNQ